MLRIRWECAALMLVVLAPVAEASCEGCHGTRDRPPGAADLSAYFSAAGHHPVGGAYVPPGDPAYLQPDARIEGVAFFDRNHNGHLDPDELRLSAAGSIECESCHREHGEGGLAVVAEPGHLRGSNADSAMCRSCHRI